MAENENMPKRRWALWTAALCLQIYAYGLAGAFVGGLGGRSNSDPIRLVWVIGFQSVGILIWWLGLRAAFLREKSPLDPPAPHR